MPQPPGLGTTGVHRPQLSWAKVSYEPAGMAPLVAGRERLGEDVRGHACCLAVLQGVMPIDKTLVEEGEINSMGTTHMPHVRILSRLDNP